ncbi:hypothetical protein E2542_SST02783 [Spatholobus suberectus]|nr:hypothetical protein E2542_SST02783 [Spatholobus suberectus]
MNPRPLQTWLRGAAVIICGIATMNLASTVTLKALRLHLQKVVLAMFISWRRSGGISAAQSRVTRGPESVVCYKEQKQGIETGTKNKEELMEEKRRKETDYILFE